MERHRAVGTNTPQVAESEGLSQAHRSPHTFEVVRPKHPGYNNKGLGGFLPDKYKFKAGGHENDPTTLAYKADPEHLQGDSNPYKVYAREKPEHRLMIFLKAQGLSNKEIAVRMDYTEITVGEVLRQPWARIRLVAELKEAGRDEIQAVIKGEGLNSIFTLVDLRDDVQVPAATRRASADSILDRFLGKATQKVETSTQSTPSSPELQQLDQQIKDLEVQINQQTANAATPTNENQTPV